MRKSLRNEPRLAIVSTYVPRKCGLATFAQLVGAAYAKAGVYEEKLPLVVAMTDADTAYSYPDEVGFEIRADVQADYAVAADYLNRAPIDVVVLQHEYGIFGGPDGEWILDFVRKLEKPLVATLHTVLPEPTPGQRDTLAALGELASEMIVLSKSAIPTLEEVYGVSKRKIVHIPHGAPDLPFSDPEFYKETIDLTGQKVMLTFGHLGPGKGIEMALNALAKIVDDFPDVMYLIVGATHPGLLRHEGEAYRERLIAQTETLGLTKNVRFVNKYVSDTELAEYLQAADIYISPYPDPAQVSSGPLAFATGAGKAVIATPYVAAKELLSSGRGILTPFNDPDTLAENMRAALSDGAMTVKIRKAAYKYGRSFTWENVGKATRSAASDILCGQRLAFPASDRPTVSVSSREWAHLSAITDDVGVLQHARHSVADRNHGYCTDDNARALIAACYEFKLSGLPEANRIARKSLEFILHAKSPSSSRMRNFMSFERRWLEKAGADDSHGRAVWALGVAVAQAPDEDMMRCAFELFGEVAPWLRRAKSPRSWAFGALGCAAYLDKYPGDAHVRKLGLLLASRIAALYSKVAVEDWRWFETILAYDNARKPEALLAMAPYDETGSFRKIGLASLAWLFSACWDSKQKCVSLIGSDGWWSHGESRAIFDQQPVDAVALVSAAAKAYAISDDTKWTERMQAAYEWFLGRNVLGTPLVEAASGGCRDGLTPIGANRNLGAESTISWMLAQLEMAIQNVEVADTRRSHRKSEPETAPPAEIK